MAALRQTKVCLAQCPLVTVNCFHPLILHISGQNTCLILWPSYPSPYLVPLHTQTHTAPIIKILFIFFHPPSHQAGCGALLGMPRKEYTTSKYIYVMLPQSISSVSSYLKPNGFWSQVWFLEVDLMLWNTQAEQQGQVTAPTLHLQYLLTHWPVLYSIIIALLTFSNTCVLFLIVFLHLYPLQLCKWQLVTSFLQ